MVLSAREPVQRKPRHRGLHTARLTLDLLLTAPETLQGHAGVLGKDKIVLDRSATLITRAFAVLRCRIGICQKSLTMP